MHVKSASVDVARRKSRQLYIFIPAGLTLSVVVWLTYTPTLAFDFTGWDTVSLVKAAHDNLNNSILAFFSEPLFPGMSLGYYRPIASLSYGLDYLAWGLEPLGYHLTNVLIHWAVCLGLLVLGYQATRRVVVGWVAGMLLAIQPLFGTMIANISYRHDTLSTLGVVWSLVFTYAFLRSRGWERFAWQGLAWCAYIIAVGSKESGLVALPLVAALIAFTQPISARGWIQKLVLMAPFGLITIVFLALHRLAVPAYAGSAPRMTSIWHSLALDYVQPLLAPETFSPLPARTLLILFLAAVAVVLYVNRKNRVPRMWLLLCVAWIGLMLLMYLATDTTRVVARYSYIIAAPLVLIIAIGLFTGLEGQSRPLSFAGYGAKFLFIGILLLWLPNAPIFGLEPVWVTREATADAYLDELDRIVAELPTATSLEMEEVPPKWLWFNSTQQWLDLKWADKKIRVVKQKSAKKPRGQPVLSVKVLQTPQQVRLSAIYLSKEE